MSERKILEKLIADGKEAERRLKELDVEEVTYSIGDRFKFCGNVKMLLTCIDGKVGLVHLASGANWGQNWSSAVKDRGRITEVEMGDIWGGTDTHTRYWDSRKKVKS